MSNLETFVREHRNEFDVFTPSAAVWSNIEAGINHPTFFKSKLSWLKYAGFGASAVAALVYLNIVLSTKEEVLPATTAKTQISSPMQEVAKQAPLMVQPDPGQKKQEPVLASLASADRKPESSCSKNEIPISQPVLSGMPKDDGQTVVGYVSKESTQPADTVFEGAQTIEIISTSADINIVGGPGSAASFQHATALSSNEVVFGKQKFAIEWDSKSGALKITQAGKAQGDSSAVKEKNKSRTLSMIVPANIGLTIRGKSGDVKASGLKGKLCDIQLKSGDLQLEDMQTQVRVDLKSGDIIAKKISGNISINSFSGDITASNIDGNIDVETLSGDNHFKSVKGSVKVTSKSGDIELTDVEGNAIVALTSGDILLNNYKGTPVLETISGDIQGKEVTLTGNTKLDTKSGNILMKLINPVSALSFELQTVHGNLSVEKDGQKIKENKNLSMKNGNILIEGHTISGDQQYE